MMKNILATKLLARKKVACQRLPPAAAVGLRILLKNAHDDRHAARTESPMRDIDKYFYHAH